MITSMQVIRHIAENDEVDRELIVKYAEQQEKVNELLGLYQKLLKYIGLYNASTYCTKETLKDLEQKIKKTQNQINQLEEKMK